MEGKVVIDVVETHADLVRIYLNAKTRLESYGFNVECMVRLPLSESTKDPPPQCFEVHENSRLVFITSDAVTLSLFAKEIENAVQTIVDRHEEKQ